ncbi:MAG: hypothetical protein HBSAPP03_11930 [Phycisphaerae bacterium]|nr:MAG: hypothetical protein HBSAPP03_11930 [Phycisphaerae bacterium]
MALTVLLGLQGAALAQSMAVGVQSPRQFYKPEFTRTDMTILGRVLLLSDEEREPLLALYEGHASDLKAAAEVHTAALEDRIERAEALKDVSSASVPQEEVGRWKEEADRIKRAFVDDLKSLLTSAQANRWPLAEREMRRFKRISAGRLGGESLDLVRLVEEHVPEAWGSADVTEALLRYADAMDGALRTRDEAIGESRSEEFERLVGTDRAGALRVWEEAQAARIAVRDLNLRYAEQVASVLAPEQATALRRAVLEKSYPKLCEPTRSEKVIRAAAALSTLDESQRREVREIVEGYETRRLALLREMAAVAKEQQEKKKPARLDPKGSNMQVATTEDGNTISFYSSDALKPPADDPMIALRERRFELDRATRRKVEAVLTASQREAVRQPAQDMVVFDFEDVWGL